MRDKNKIIATPKLRMTRPIQTVGGKSYFATSVLVRMKDNSTKYCWLVASADGAERYSEVELDDHLTFDKAPFQIDMAGIPRPDLTLSFDAYQAHVLNKQPLPSPGDLFRAVTSEIDRFVSFSGSFASQQDMAEFVGCWTLSTYATDVFDTVGYLWPNGERGCGKTQCMKVITALSFMGQTITASSSFASVRDEAALGGTLGFDDCENIQKMDGNKRELLLAGNTKGAGFIHKEPGKRDGTWIQRYVDCFAPRLFTSIGLPDDVLFSRTILIPLTRTSDSAKTRRKPTNLRDWNTSPALLRDQLWVSIARSLDRISASKSAVNDSSHIAGRDFDIFQPILTIAYWLQHDCGVEGLFDRMLKVMSLYHETKHRNNLPSFEQVVLQSICDLLNRADRNSNDLSTREIALQIHEICNRWDITEQELINADVQRVGILLGRLGFRKKAGHAKSRGWTISLEELLEKSRSAGITLEVFESTEGCREVDVERIPVHVTSDQGPIPW